MNPTGVRMKTKLNKFDISAHLSTPEDIVGYLEASIEEGGLELFQKALGDVARAKGISEVSENTGITRMGLYKALSASGKPQLSTIDKVLSSLGLTLKIERADRPRRAIA